MFLLNNFDVEVHPILANYTFTVFWQQSIAFFSEKEIIVYLSNKNALQLIWKTFIDAKNSIRDHDQTILKLPSVTIAKA